MGSEIGATVYSIETQRLLLRCWTPEDAGEFRAMLDESNDHLRPWIPWMRDEPRSLEETAQRLREHRASFDLGKHYRYAIIARGRGALVGEASLFNRVGDGGQELGYMLHKDAAGQGYALEAAAALVKVAFDVNGMQRVEIHCAPENAASMALARKLGFRHEATLRRRGTDSEGVVRDSALWTLFSDEYQQGPCASAEIFCRDCMNRKVRIQRRSQNIKNSAT